MKKFFRGIQVFIVCLGLLGVSACSPPVDHKAFACESIGELRKAWLSPESDFDVLRAKFASFAGVLAVWQSDKGEEDPLFWKISDYSKAFSAMLLDTSPASAKAYFAVEDKLLSTIETKCDLPSTYVKPLTVNGGCWNNKGVSAELQVLESGKWIRDNKVSSLTKTGYCKPDAPDYPWGVSFTVRRSSGDGYSKNYRIVWSDPAGQEFDSGKTRHTTCPISANNYESKIEFPGQDCGD